MKSSWRWGPLIGGCKSFLKVLRTGMTNWADFFRPKNLPNISIYFTIVFWPILFTIWVRKLPFSKGFFHMFILGSCYCTLIGCSPKWTVLPKMNNCCYCHPIGRSPKWTIAVPALLLVAPQNEHLKKAFIKWQFSHLKREQNWSKKNLWLDRYVGKGFWAKNQLNWSFQSIAPSRMIYTHL